LRLKADLPSRLPRRSPGTPRRSWRRRRLGYDGRLQAVVNGCAIGWAWDADEPDRRVEVAIEVDEQVVASGVADIFRDELVAADIGDGVHGFSLDLPEVLQAQAHVRVVALVGSAALRLPRSPSFWHSATPGGLWGGVTFSYGREGDPDSVVDLPVEVPPPPELAALRALVGRDGWLFDAAGLAALQEPSAADLERVAGELVDIARACAALGVAYVPALVPEKLQAVMEGAPPDTGLGPLWPERLRARLRDTDEVEILDLLPVLDDARGHGLGFHRSDPGWNDRGAFFIARALIKEAAKRAPVLGPLPLSRLHLNERPGYRGLLADAPAVRSDGARCESDFREEQGLEIDVARLSTERMPVERHLVGGDVHVRLRAKPGGAASPRLSIVGDESCLSLLPWLAESAERTTFFWASTPPMEPVELELPDALLHLIRYLDLSRLGIDQPATP
jgi:GNAT superfamily N-acetyltransferase